MPKMTIFLGYHLITILYPFEHLFFLPDCDALSSFLNLKFEVVFEYLFQPAAFLSGKAGPFRHCRLLPSQQHGHTQGIEDVVISKKRFEYAWGRPECFPQTEDPESDGII